MASDTAIIPVERLKEQLAEIEEKVVTGFHLADAIREGAGVSDKVAGTWVRGDQTCALGAGWVAAKARGYVPE